MQLCLIFPQTFATVVVPQFVCLFSPNSSATGQSFFHAFITFSSVSVFNVSANMKQASFRLIILEKLTTLSLPSFSTNNNQRKTFL